MTGTDTTGSEPALPARCIVTALHCDMHARHRSIWLRSTCIRQGAVRVTERCGSGMHSFERVISRSDHRALTVALTVHSLQISLLIRTRVPPDLTVQPHPQLDSDRLARPRIVEHILTSFLPLPHPPPCPPPRRKGRRPVRAQAKLSSRRSDRRSRPQRVPVRTRLEEEMSRFSTRCVDRRAGRRDGANGAEAARRPRRDSGREWPRGCSHWGRFRARCLSYESRSGEAARRV